MSDVEWYEGRVHLCERVAELEERLKAVEWLLRLVTIHLPPDEERPPFGQQLCTIVVPLLSGGTRRMVESALRAIEDAKEGASGEKGGADLHRVRQEATELGEEHLLRLRTDCDIPRL